MVYFIAIFIERLSMGNPAPPPALCCRSRGRFSMSFFGFVVVVVDGEKAVQGQRHIQFSVFFVAAAVAGVAVVVAAAVVVSHIHGLRSVWLFSRFCLFRVASAATAFFFSFFCEAVHGVFVRPHWSNLRGATEHPIADTRGACGKKKEMPSNLWEKN